MAADLVAKAADHDICQFWIGGFRLIQSYLYGLQYCDDFPFSANRDLTQMDFEIIGLRSGSGLIVIVGRACQHWHSQQTREQQ
jgi:hypothetical protein